jgi:hypothetical protein
MFGSENLVLNKIYSTPDGKYYYFTRFMLYLSHIKLVRSNGSMVEVNPLYYLGAQDSTTLSIPLSDSLGSFTGIQFSIGVDSIQDSAYPYTGSSADLIDGINNQMYWDSARKYVFVILEGAGDQNNPPQQAIEYHVGTNPYYTTVQLTYPFSVAVGKQTTLMLNTNIEQIFYGSSGSINVLTDPYTETTGSTYYANLAHTFMTDFSQTFSISQQ